MLKRNRILSLSKTHTIHFCQLLSKNLFRNVEKIRVGGPVRRRGSRVLRRRVVQRVGHDERRRVGVAGVQHRSRRLQDQRRRTVWRRHTWPDTGGGAVGLKMDWQR
jgi:hypothetical protein